MAQKMMNIRISESKRATTTLRNHGQNQNKNYMNKWLNKIDDHQNIRKQKSINSVKKPWPKTEQKLYEQMDQKN